MRGGYYIQYAVGGPRRTGERSRMAERAITNDGNAMPLAPGNHRMFDRSFLQMV